MCEIKKENRYPVYNTGKNTIESAMQMLSIVVLLLIFVFMLAQSIANPRKLPESSHKREGTTE